VKKKKRYQHIERNIEIKTLAYAKLYRQRNRNKYKEYKKQWDKIHRDEIMAYQKQWHETHRNEISAYNKLYYQKNRDKRKAFFKKYYEIHRNERLAYAKLYYQKNQDRYKQLIKTWEKNHKEKVYEAAKKSHFKRKRSLGFIPLNEWFEGSEAHHIDKDRVIYMPKEYHQSIRHNVWTGRNMALINALAFDYLLETKVSEAQGSER